MPSVEGELKVGLMFKSEKKNVSINSSHQDWMVRTPRLLDDVKDNRGKEVPARDDFSEKV